jgi:hypothetical protein
MNTDKHRCNERPQDVVASKQTQLENKLSSSPKAELRPTIQNLNSRIPLRVVERLDGCHAGGHNI